MVTILDHIISKIWVRVYIHATANQISHIRYLLFIFTTVIASWFAFKSEKQRHEPFPIPNIKLGLAIPWKYRVAARRRPFLLLFTHYAWLRLRHINLKVGKTMISPQWYAFELAICYKNVHFSMVHGIKRKPNVSVEWKCYSDCSREFTSASSVRLS